MEHMCVSFLKKTPRFLIITVVDFFDMQQRNTMQPS